MADDDFEIDLYGDSAEGNEESYQDNGEEDMGLKMEESGADNSVQHGQNNDQVAEQGSATHNGDMSSQQPDGDGHEYTNGVKEETGGDVNSSTASHPSAQGEATSRNTPVQQGVKRKEHDDRPTDPGASSAITVSELHWWITDDDIRGWTKQHDCENELKDITFSEHKVNGKSKGQVYIELESPQAATAIKRHVEGLAAAQPASNKYTVIFSSPATNPFRTLPRNDAQRNAPSNASGGRGNYNNNNNQGGFNRNRGGRGPGNMNNMASGNRGGFQGGGQMGNMQSGFGNQGQMGGFGGNAMGGFQNNFGNRGGMMGNMRGGAMPNRGGRGGFGAMPNTMMGGGMNMGAAMGNMGNMGMGNMGMMGGQFGNPMGMQGMAFGGQGHFNPAFFQNQNNQQQMGGGNDWNPHGAKRPRPE